MRISDWSSDVCSSDLAYDHGATGLQARLDRYRAEAGGTKRLCAVRQHRAFDPVRILEADPAARVDRRTSAGGERHMGAVRARLADRAVEHLPHHPLRAVRAEAGVSEPAGRSTVSAPVPPAVLDRKSVVSGKSLSERVVPGGRRSINKKKK